MGTVVDTANKEANGSSLSEKKVTVVFVLGGPGSGKGTQCENIVRHFGYTHLSAGDLLRAEIKSGSENGTMIQNMIKDGKIVPSEVTIKLLQRAMLESSNDKFLIDGFPRNEENRAVFESVTGIEPEFVLFLDCPKEEMERRLLGRNQVRQMFFPIEKTILLLSSQLHYPFLLCYVKGREDDNIDTIRKRFKVYMESSLPVIEYYNSKGKVRKILLCFLLQIDAAKTVEEVFEAVKAVFTKMNPVEFNIELKRGKKDMLPRCCTSLGNFFAAYYDTTISGVFRARPVRSHVSYDCDRGLI
ncbi:hypothetical protein RHGRI_001269 [Rhododendron griersonianum]|uniref:UMP-CMP kinase n=1 Tax=Rhododendron griersonianum TaxID=479676 RepID=A0AAV6LJK6_9ERIC|nr:hypothetical protein RHGRI_001269 [Rhododendron griersonianum]